MKDIIRIIDNLLYNLCMPGQPRKAADICFTNGIISHLYNLGKRPGPMIFHTGRERPIYKLEVEKLYGPTIVNI